jgi:periplasmic copper chaperone A
VRRSFVGAAVVLGLAACGSGDDDDALRVHDAWARATPAVVSVGAVYLRIASPVDDELLGASVDASIAAAVQVHSTEVDDAGTATMTEQAALPVPAGGEIELDPLGDHLMLVDLVDPLTTGETFDVTLHFATAGDVPAEVEVRDDPP